MGNNTDDIFDNVINIPNKKRTREDTYKASCSEVRHVLFLVPGTTDPVNINEYYSGDASMGYWDDTFLEDMELFISDRAIHESVRAGYDTSDFHTVFRWSGDNNFCSRYAAAKKLYNQIVSFYKVTENKHIPVYIHFICHSHGGNVINEFTNIAAESKSYPKHIKIKSITYLSTPFFMDQAQLDHKILHPNCTIVNVFNKYDLTQRFVANFTMHYMPVLVKTFDEDIDFHKAIKTLKETPFLQLGASAAATDLTRGILSIAIGHDLWQSLLTMFNVIEIIVSRITQNIETLNEDYPEFITPEIKNEVLSVVDGLTKSLSIIQKKLKQRMSKNIALRNYSVASLIVDIGSGVFDLLSKINKLINFKSQESLESNLTDLINKIILNQIDKFDDTTDTPKEQIKGKFKQVDIDVTKKDPYDCTKESNNYDRFIDELEKLEDKYAAAHSAGEQPTNSERISACKTETKLPYITASNGDAIRAEIIFKLLAQEDYGFIPYLDELLKWLETLLGGSVKKIIIETRSNISRYKDEFDKRNDRILHREKTSATIIAAYNRINSILPFEMPTSINLLVEKYIDTEYTAEKKYTLPFGSAAGGIPYLAVISHSTSRRLLYPEVAAELEKLIPKSTIKSAITVKTCN